jgi:hypothetical protein
MKENDIVICTNSKKTKAPIVKGARYHVKEIKNAGKTLILQETPGWELATFRFVSLDKIIDETDF